MPPNCGSHIDFVCLCNNMKLKTLSFISFRSIRCNINSVIHALFVLIHQGTNCVHPFSCHSVPTRAKHLNTRQLIHTPLFFLGQITPTLPYIFTPLSFFLPVSNQVPTSNCPVSPHVSKYMLVIHHFTTTHIFMSHVNSKATMFCSFARFRRNLSF
jgi:hypothetical protein